MFLVLNITLLPFFQTSTVRIKDGRLSFYLFYSLLFFCFYFLYQTWLRDCDVMSHIIVIYITAIVTISYGQEKVIEGSRTNNHYIT